MKSDVKSFYIILTIKIMLMNVLLNMRMFGLFSETSQEVTNNEMQEAYGEFVEQIRTISNGNDYSTTYRILAATRIEIATITAEIELLNLKIQYPSQFQNRINSLPPSPLYLTDNTNLVEIMELISGLFLSQRVVTHAGTKSPLTEIGRAFEHLFNIKLGDVHKKHESVIKRKPSKVTDFLDTLRKAIAEESKNKGYL